MPAAHRPSIVLRRAIALKRSSSSCANCFSKPSSRLSNVVVMPPSYCIGKIAFTCNLVRPCISSADRQGNIGPFVCGENTEWKTWARRDCAAPTDRLGCLSARTAGRDQNLASTSSPVPQPRILQSCTTRSHGNPMDFHKPRYTPMSRRRRIYEGKAKVLYEGPEPGTLIQHFKDDATAFNAKKHEVIEGKGVLNNRISEYVFQHLNDIGVPTHFIRRLNMREQLIREVEIIPLEVVVRNVAAGSLAQRLGIEEGTQLPRSIIEFYYKNDKLNDPMVSEEHITA